VTAVSRTDKTNPYRIKQDQHPRQWWRPEFRCTCRLCKAPGLNRELRREGKRQARDWWREYV
jgi:hypothetical protein